MSDAKSYKESWVRLEDIGGGGQGTTIKARLIEDETAIAAVKVLNKQKDRDRRARLHRESTTLSTLDHPNIARFIDSNSQHFKDESYALFIATEYISGPTLSAINFSEIAVEQKISAFKWILLALDYCHKQGILHRDIKPDNIILRNGDMNIPVILDFGLSFNMNADDDDWVTPDGKQIGNRFLILTEQKVGEPGKRDFRSDIACAVGILFFMLTGFQPVIPVDEQDRKPHQKEAKSIIDQLPKHQKDIINNIFDTGFERLIDRRWQTVQSVLDQVEIFENSKPDEGKGEVDYIAEIMAKTAKHTYQDLKFLQDIFRDVDKQTRDVLGNIAKELGPDWSSIQSGGSSGDTYKNLLAPHNSVISYSGRTVIHALTTGNELIIQINEDKSIQEFFRQPIRGDHNWKNYKERLREHYLKQIHNSMNS